MKPDDGGRVPILGLIPARGGSKGIPRKNLAPFCGRPLLACTIDAARSSRRLSDLVVSTDDDEIAAVARAAGVDVVRRPADLAADGSPMMPVVVHALETRERETHTRFEALVLLQPPCPLRLAEDIDGAIDKLLATGAACVVSVCEAGEHPLRAKRIVDDRVVPFAGAEPPGGLRQGLPPAYRRNGAIYVLRRALAFEPDPIRTAEVRPYVMPVERSVDIDTWLEFRLAELLMREREATARGAHA